MNVLTILHMLERVLLLAGLRVHPNQVEQITDGIPDYSAPASDDYGGYGDDYAYDYRRRRSAGRQKRFDMNAYGKIIISFPEKDDNFFC